MSTARTAFVTGTSTGFGNLTAKTLAASGYHVYATMRDIAGRNAAVAAEFTGLGIEVLEVDLTSDTSVDAAVAHVLAKTGAPSLVVNNAGASYSGVVEAFTPAEVARQFDVNVFSVLRVNRAFLPAMRAAKSGLIVYVSSVVGRIVAPFMGVYAASKFALEALAEASYYELKTFGVDVAIVQPDAFGTNIAATRTEPADTDRVGSYGDFMALRMKVGGELAKTAAGNDPQAIADLVLRLAELPAGKRPLRTVVGGNATVERMNAAIAPLQRESLVRFGLGELATPESAAPEPASV